MLLRVLRCSPVVLLSTACSVYNPLQVAAPAIDGPRQAEVSGGLSTLGNWQGTVAYSPVRHVLLRAAAGGGRADGYTTRDTIRLETPFRSRQLELAVGTYWRPGPTVLLGGLIGYGRGTGTHWYSKRSGLRGALLQPPRTPDSLWIYQYAARYRQLFADAYVQRSSDNGLTLGATYRVSHVQFGRYTNAGVPTGFRQMWRHEPGVFLRTGDARADNGRVSAQLAVSYAFSPGFRQPLERAGNRDATEVRKSRLVFTFSLIVWPHLFWPPRSR